MRPPIETTLSAEDHEAALIEVGFLLKMLSSTIEDVIGNPAPLGVSAGRAMAQKIPVRLFEPPLEKVLAVLGQALKGGIEFASTQQEYGATLEVGTCAVRDMCRMQGEEIGSRVCKLFHHYLSGMCSQIYGKQTRIEMMKVGELCTLELKTK